MADEESEILEDAHSEFNRRNYEEAEKLYTKFITSCLQSRYMFVFLNNDRLANKLTPSVTSQTY